MVAPILLATTYVLGLAIATIAAVDDARTHLLRDIYTGPLALVAVVGFALVAIADDTGLPIDDLGLGVAIFAGPWLASYLISPASIGFGDVKYGAGLGLYLGLPGPVVAVHALALATAAGALVALVSLAARGRREPLPFGPALLMGTVTALAFAWPWEAAG